jgi:hypothetical protein
VNKEIEKCEQGNWNCLTGKYTFGIASVWAC